MLRQSAQNLGVRLAGAQARALPGARAGMGCREGVSECKAAQMAPGRGRMTPGWRLGGWGQGPSTTGARRAGAEPKAGCAGRGP